MHIDKNQYQKYFEEKINLNFDKLNPYFDVDSDLFSGLNRLMNENYRCLMVEAYVASITISNHIIERLLKLALIYENSLGETEEIAIKAYNKFQGMAMKNTITNCWNRKLISNEEKSHLEKIINDVVRNGFSHASFENILGKTPTKIPMKMGDFKTQEIKDVEIDRRVMLTIAEVQLENFAKENAFEYYKYIFELIQRLENKIKPKEDKNGL
ncbi:hypothetical protein IVB69_05715 [Flavobacterium sp. J49]|uniref:hypothetical protein n=1 Tax=Flavobacterium sp. J49 TaxID=2718534 RepID=UPI0015944735|nr:hypothetical protein [Flavobacterium sp. J49]MBF6640969.1 hypothetical protein [Flavobacterium sp. J49]NIC02216.1 hypothetical protein [Flavobacterium sp. J49]